MIQAFQKFSQSRIAKVFLAIVALSFIIFGGSRFFHSRHPHAVVAEVGDVYIGREELAEKVHHYTQNVSAETGESPKYAQLLEAGVPQMILENLIQDVLLNLEAKHLDLTVSDEILRNRIQSMKAFHNEKGQFDRHLFVQILRSNGLSEEAFIAEMRQELVREQLVNAITIGAYLPDEMIDPLFDVQHQYRQAALLLVGTKDVPTPPTPPDETLEAFYKKHKKEFETPELRTIAFLILDPTVIGKNIPVTEEEIKTAYEAKPEVFGKQKLEEVKQQVMAEVQKEKAIENMHNLTQEIDDKIAGGATFEELAPTIQGAQLIKLTDVDRLGRDRLEIPSPQLLKDPEFAQELLKAAFELEEGSDIPFTQAKNGAYFTLRVDKVTPPALQSFAEIRERVLKTWLDTEKLKAAFTRAEHYKQSINQRNQKPALMTLLPNISLSEPSPTVSDEVKNLIYSLQVGKAGIVQVPEGFAVVMLNTIIPAKPQVKEEKIASFKEILLKRYRNDLLSAYVNALRVRYPVKRNDAAIRALYAQ